MAFPVPSLGAGRNPEAFEALSLQGLQNSRSDSNSHKSILKDTRQNVTSSRAKKSVTFANPPLAEITEMHLDPDTENWRIIYQNSCKWLHERHSHFVRLKGSNHDPLNTRHASLYPGTIRTVFELIRITFEPIRTNRLPTSSFPPISP